MTAKETLDLTVSIPLQELPMKECVESILISVYTAAVVSDIATFHSCLIHLSILPDRWTCERPPDWTGYHLVLYKAEYNS